MLSPASTHPVLTGVLAKKLEEKAPKLFPHVKHIGVAQDAATGGDVVAVSVVTPKGIYGSCCEPMGVYPSDELITKLMLVAG